MSNSVHFGDALGAKVCVDTEVVSLTIMSNSQHNVGTFLIKPHFSYDIKILYLFFLKWTKLAVIKIPKCSCTQNIGSKMVFSSSNKGKALLTVVLNGPFGLRVREGK